MAALPCSSEMYKQIARAIDVLSQHDPESPVIGWWTRAGMSLSLLGRNDFLPLRDQDVACHHMAYLKKALAHAIQTRDVDDIEYLITRLVSDLEEIDALLEDGRSRSDG